MVRFDSSKLNTCKPSPWSRQSKPMPTDTHRRTPKHGLLHRVNFDFSASVPASISSSVRKQKITRARTPPTQAEGEEKGRIGEGERPSPTHLVWARRRRRRARRRLGNAAAAAAAAWESRRDLAAVPRHPLPPRTRPLSVCGLSLDSRGFALF